ncbi:hypothetical protein NUU61_001369 [Penicillium alfredii]|uniref:Uncharacterized protein n=1 Tax=Penicillium alfredii TaxID=1506179 RepID=A0A9W9G477_9EURO|nr:uncharacterized protein NUU61_001369 [Penicillium alfredii]KAJ5111739.1 hypothetical protein NUU61_001369 [Penicillium alfredii]
MSVSVILSQFEALVNKMELVGSRLCNKRIRPTADQLNDFQNLHTRFKATLANFDNGVQKLLAIGSPAAEDLLLADRIRAAKDSAPITSPILTTLKRNLILIFMGPKTFELDSKQVKARNKQTEGRCKTLRSQHSHVVLMWAMALQPSIWKTSVGMNEKTFDFLIRDLSDERMNQIPPHISEIMLSLAGEESMSTSDSFALFAEKVSKDTVELQPALKRRRTTGIEAHSTVFEAVNEKHMLSSMNTESHVEQHTANNIPKIQQNRRKEI